MTTYNPNFFSTHPSGGAVPANQIMMAAQQQPHMLAAGQPMMPMMAAQQPMQQMMMVPAGQQQQQMMGQPMMYAPAPMQQQQQQQQVKAVVQTKPKIQHGPEGSKQFTVVGVENPHLLEVEAPNLSWQMMKAGTPSGKDYLYSYDPAKQIHNVSVKYNKEHVDGSPFQLMPKEMREPQVIQPAQGKEDKEPHNQVFLSFDKGDPHHLIARNVPDVDKLDFKTDMGFQLLTDPSDPKAFHLKLKSTGKVHPLDVTYGGEMVPNGQFEFVPKAMKETHTYNKQKDQMAAQVNSTRKAYMQSVAAMDKLSLNAPAEQKPEPAQHVRANQQIARQSPPKESRMVHRAPNAAPQQVAKPREMAAATLSARVPHMTQAANYGPMVMSSQQAMPQAQMQPQPMMAAPQQAMMMAPQPMYANGGAMGPPMYMVPQQQMMMQGQQPRMYKQ